jgi:hypothetical protein
MRLYPRDTSTTSVVHGGVRYEAASDGGFDFPGGVSDGLHALHLHGEPMWETPIERQRRLITEEAARRADPATLLDAVEKLVAQAEAGASEPVKAKAAAGK